jgi:hypothetical protein
MRSHFPLITATLVAGLIGLPLIAFGQPAAAPVVAPPSTVVSRAIDRMTAPPSADRLRDMRDRASVIIGASVYDDHGEAIGKVDDLLVGPANAGLTAVIAVGGFLGMGDRLVTMPLVDLHFGGSEGHWTLAGASKDSLTARPAFHYDGRR